VIAITAYEALEEICTEIRQFGEPANPALSIQLRNAYTALKAGGAVVGFYGQGKSLLANLTALVELLQGRPAVVVKANQVLMGETKLDDISTCRRLNQIVEICGKTYREWLGKVVEIYEERALQLDCEERVEVEGQGMNKLDTNIVSLKSKGFTIIVDELERLVEQPTTYGFKDLLDLREQFFDLVDRRRGAVGFVIPATLWATLDVQIKSRIARVYFIPSDIKPEHMREFMRRKLGQMPKEFELIEFRNPRAVVAVLRELASGKSPAEVINRRLEVLRALADLLAKGPRVKKALFIALTATWLKQNVYTEFNTSTIQKAVTLVEEYLGERLDIDVDAALKVLKRNRKVRRGVAGYYLSPLVVHELEELARGGGYQKRLLALFGEDVVQIISAELGVV